MRESQARKIHAEIEALSGPDLPELRADLYRLAVRYARIRTDWQLAPGPERREIGVFACHLHAFLGLRAR